MKRPIARKVLDNRSIYYSRPTPFSAGLPVLCDLGEARIGIQKHRGDVMPGIYRAPEVILGMEWDSKVDVWSIGVMVVTLYEFETSLISNIIIPGLGFSAERPPLLRKEKPHPRRRAASGRNGIPHGTPSSRISQTK